ncbi:MAG: DUF4389 domain-containing protein [Spirochaetia bacterium]
MTLSITHQDRSSRGQLLLRTIFGFIYILIPHGFLLFFLGIWSSILSFITFWIVLFTANFPESIFNWQVKYMNWNLRVSASISNFVDGYPSFGIKGSSDNAKLDVPRPERVSRGLVILRVLLGTIYVMIPHGICLLGRLIAHCIIGFLSWWAVLFTGEFPAKWHAFLVGTYRWSFRLSLYLGYFTDTYPPFSGKA